MLDLKSIKSVHFIGIGGVSLSSLALLMRKKNIAVTGSDRSFSEKIPQLIECGCDVWIGTDPTRIGKPDLTVYTSAIGKDNEELIYCKNNGIPCKERYVLLGELASLFHYTVAVAGTHGKTTVTAMLTHVFIQAGLPFYGHVGGDMVDIGGFYYSGDKYFLTEACEYRKSLLSLQPDIGIVLNAESDHPDTYLNLSDVYDTFDCFLENSRLKGLAITDGDTKYYQLRQAHSDTVTYGFNSNNRFTAENLYMHKKGFYGFTICDYGNPLCNIKLNVPGKHNVVNALACFTVASVLKLPSSVIATALNGFAGVKRRFEKTCLFCGATVYSDYAHHPSEIKAAIAAALEVKDTDRRLIVVFQPHTYSRTAKLYDEFLTCFSGCDELIICREYAARETPDKGLDAAALYRGIENIEKSYCDNIVDIAAHLIKTVSPDDLILVLGAGDIVNLCSLLSS